MRGLLSFESAETQLKLPHAEFGRCTFIRRFVSKALFGWRSFSRFDCAHDESNTHSMRLLHSPVSTPCGDDRLSVSVLCSRRMHASVCITVLNECDMKTLYNRIYNRRRCQGEAKDEVNRCHHIDDSLCEIYENRIAGGNRAAAPSPPSPPQLRTKRMGKWEKNR